jgi:hypothetical protein
VSATAPATALTPDQEEQARQALRDSNAAMEPAAAAQAMQPQTPAPAPAVGAPVANPSSTSPAMSTTGTPAAAMPPANAAAPAMPSAADSREARLAELLMLYNDDKISPAEYQARRAKILSGQ